MEVHMELREVQMVSDPNGVQVIVLGEVGGERAFPILVGHYEAQMLDLTLHRIVHPRPLTHDLVLNAIVSMGGELSRVIVDDLKNDTFFGKLAVTMPSGEEVLIDTRPSDAIVIATKAGVPIHVNEHVLEQARGGPPDA